jgi:geranylgeranyl reductase family protein
MSPDYDVIVVGAGPAGSVAAREAARLGCGSVLLLDKSRFPRDKVCAGGVSPKAVRALRRLGLWDRIAPGGYPINAIRVEGLRRRWLRITDSPLGVVVSRKWFDQALVEAAVESGVEFRAATPVRELLYEAGRAAGVRVPGGSITARWLVVAGGASCRWRWDPRPWRTIYGCVARFEGVRCAPNALELLYSREVLPCYAWLFPESETQANVGVGVEAAWHAPGDARNLLEHVLDSYFKPHLATARQVGPVRTFPIRSALAAAHYAPGGVLVAGEANGLTNAASGEGIGYAVRSGALAARAIRQGIDAAEPALRTARRYESALKRSFRLHLAYARLFSHAGMHLLSVLPLLGGARLVRGLSLAVLTTL